MGWHWTSGFLLAMLGVLAPSSAASALAQGAAAPAPVTAPAPSASAPEPTARVVRLDAVAIDAQGKPVLDLGPGDFEVVENGVLQRLDAVEVRRASAAASVPRSPILTAEDERAAARTRGTRVIALLLDEFHVAPGAPTERVRSSMLRFLDEHVRPSDLLVVLKPLDPLTDIRFTRDRDAVRAAIAGFSGRKGDYDARTEFEEKYIGRAPAAVRAARSRIVLSGLRALISRLEELGAGRSAVVLVTEGFTGEGRHGRTRRVPDAQALVRAASRANVAIYALDPGDRPEPADDDGAQGDDARSRETLIELLASQTGGKAASDAAGFDAVLRQVSRDLDGYYLLSYTSSHGEDGRFYDVEVRTRRPGVRIRTRTGYWAPVRIEPVRTVDRRAAPPRVVRRSPLIDTWLGLTMSADGVPHLTFTWRPAARRTRAATMLGTPSTVGLRVTTPEGAVLFEGEIGAARTRGGLREDVAYFEAVAGRLLMDLIIFAADGRQLDQAAQDVEVPGTPRNDPLILPPHVFSAGSAREFRDLAVDPAAAPEPGREFRRTERLLLRVPVYSKRGAETTVTLRVLNRAGQPLRDVDPMQGAMDGMTQFDLPLAWLAPGEYNLELSAKNAAGAAREIVRIRVTG